MYRFTVGARLLHAVVLGLIVAVAAPIAPLFSATATIVQTDAVEGGDPDDEGGDDALPGLAIGEDGLTVTIEAGSCATRAENTVAVPLAAAAAIGPSAAGDVFVSDTEIAVALNDLLAQPHAIAVDVDAAGLSVPVACGDVAGTVAGGRLVVGLRSAEIGGLTGLAVLTEVEGGATSVESYLILAGEPGAGTEGGDEGGDSEDGEADEDEEADDGEGGV